MTSDQLRRILVERLQQVSSLTPTAAEFVVDTGVEEELISFYDTDDTNSFEFEGINMADISRLTVYTPAIGSATITSNATISVYWLISTLAGGFTAAQTTPATAMLPTLIGIFFAGLASISQTLTVDQLVFVAVAHNLKGNAQPVAAWSAAMDLIYPFFTGESSNPPADALATAYALKNLGFDVTINSANNSIRSKELILRIG